MIPVIERLGLGRDMHIKDKLYYSFNKLFNLLLLYFSYKLLNYVERYLSE